MESSFADLLKRYRALRGMSIVELAAASGLDRNSIAAWEQGKRVPRDTGRVKELAEALRLSSREEEEFITTAGILRQQRSRRYSSDMHSSRFEAKSEARVIYDSRTEVPPFQSWERYCTVMGGHEERIRVIGRASDGLASFEIKAMLDEIVGVNKTISSVQGKVEFDYKAINTNILLPNVVFYAIPVQELWIEGRKEIVEAGSYISDGKLVNPLSYRKGITIPREQRGDNQWHRAILSFDFREISAIVYSIFAPRINEGCAEAGAAHFLISNIQFSV